MQDFNEKGLKRIAEGNLIQGILHKTDVGQVMFGTMKVFQQK